MMFGHSMFGVLEVRYFGVRSKTNFDLQKHFFNTLIFFLPKNDLKNTEGLEEIYLVVVVSYFFRSLSKNSLKKALRWMTNDKKYFLKYIQFID